MARDVPRSLVTPTGELIALIAERARARTTSRRDLEVAAERLISAWESLPHPRRTPYRSAPDPAALRQHLRTLRHLEETERALEAHLERVRATRQHESDGLWGALIDLLERSRRPARKDPALREAVESLAKLLPSPRRRARK